jgi:hypothetical protein
MTSSRRRARRICNLHDCLSLGEVELGLTVSAPTTPAATPIGEVGQLHDALLQPQDRNINARPPDPEHIRHRLPLLLRLLQDSRPLSSIPDVMLVGQETSIKVLSSAEQKQGEAEPKTEGGTATTEKKAEEPNDDVVASAPPPRKKRDDLVQGAVDRLEDRVAMDPTAEDVEGVACRLAPLACRRMLRHHRARGGGGGGRRRTTLHSLSDHDVQMLLSSGATSTSNPTTKRTKLASTTSLKPSPNQQDVEDADSDDDSGRFDTGNPPPQDASKDPISEDRKKRRRMSSALASSPSRASLIQMARGEDAPETTVSRTLEELVRLVRAYSTPQVSQSAFVAGRDVAAAAEDDGTRPWLDETMLDDSILAQEGRSHRLATVSGSGSDVPSTVASLLHHAPILQAKDVAEAVCRAALPQASAIVSRIGANAPSCVPSLIGGCLRALQQRPVATAPGSASSPPPRRRDATTTAVQKSLRALAKLSPRESSRVRTALSASFDSKEYSRSDRSMLLALRLELLNVAATDAAFGDDDGVEAASLEVACLVNEHYSSSHFSSNNGNDRDRDDDNDDDNDDAEQQADENQDDADEEDAGRGARAEDSGGAGRRRNDEGAGASPTESNRHLPSRSQQGSSLLHGILCENHNLVRETLNVLRKELIRQRSHDDGQMPTAQFSIVSAAVTWILLSVPLSELDDKQGADNPFHALLHELQAWVARIRSLQYYALREEMTRRGLERAFRRLVSASFAGLCAALLVGDKSNHTSDLCDVCISMLSDLLLLLPQSITVPGISSFSARFLLRSGRHDVLSLIEASLLQVEPTFDPLTEPNEIVTRACRRLCSEFTSEQLETICLELPSRTSAPIDLEYGLDLVGDVLLPENKRSDRLRELLERLLERSAAADHLQNPITPAFIESSVFFFAHRQGPSSLPIIHPVTLERLAIHLTFERTRSLSGDEKHFILCLYYWFVYRHFAKIETFSVDFRSLPIVAVRYICMNAHRFGLCASLGSRLRCWIDNFCPESHQKKAFSYQSHDEASRLTKAQLLRTLRRSVETPQLDPSGIVAEKAFIAARRCMPESTYITTTVSAFFSEPNNLPPFFTYASLYRDPLVYVSKCSVVLGHDSSIKNPNF